MKQFFVSVTPDFDTRHFQTYRDPLAAGPDFNLDSGYGAIDARKIVLGITDGFIGTLPDVDAFEQGDSMPAYRVSHPP